MRLTVDTDAKSLTVADDAGERTLDLYSGEAFELLSRQWVRVGWAQRYSYTFTWFGRPVIQLPEDMVRLQEAIHSIRPTVVVETGIAHGGSLVFHASLLEALGRGRVIGVDIEIRPHNRAALERHELFRRIELVEGDSTAPETVSAVRERIGPEDVVLVILDSDHSYAHVLAELEAYHELVTPGSYIVATDGIMEDLADVPGGDAGWVRDNPAAAADEFLRSHPEFESAGPERLFNESTLLHGVTYWPRAWLRRRSA